MSRLEELIREFCVSCTVPKHPQKCPQCGSKVGLLQMNLDEAAWMCSNAKCIWPLATHSRSQILQRRNVMKLVEIQLEMRKLKADESILVELSFSDVEVSPTKESRNECVNQANAMGNIPKIIASSKSLDVNEEALSKNVQPATLSPLGASPKSSGRIIKDNGEDGFPGPSSVMSSFRVPTFQLPPLLSPLPMTPFSNGGSERSECNLDHDLDLTDSEVSDDEQTPGRPDSKPVLDMPFVGSPMKIQNVEEIAHLSPPNPRSEVQPQEDFVLTSQPSAGVEVNKTFIWKKRPCLPLSNRLSLPIHNTLIDSQKENLNNNNCSFEMDWKEIAEWSYKAALAFQCEEGIGEFIPNNEVSVYAEQRLPLSSECPENMKISQFIHEEKKPASFQPSYEVLNSLAAPACSKQNEAQEQLSKKELAREEKMKEDLQSKSAVKKPENMALFFVNDEILSNSISDAGLPSSMQPAPNQGKYATSSSEVELSKTTLKKKAVSLKIKYPPRDTPMIKDIVACSEHQRSLNGGKKYRRKCKK